LAYIAAVDLIYIISSISKSIQERKKGVSKREIDMVVDTPIDNPLYSRDAWEDDQPHGTHSTSTEKNFRMLLIQICGLQIQIQIVFGKLPFARNYPTGWPVCKNQY